MRIGVDARCLSVPITGIGQYTLQLLQRMVGKGHEWFLYSHRPLVVDIFERDNIRLCCGRHVLPFIGSLWAQFKVPLMLRRHGIDLFWSPRHHLPVFCPAEVKQVVTIHDLVWKFYPRTMRKLNYLLDSRLMPVSVKQADAVICVSHATAADLAAEIPAAAGKIEVIWSGSTLFSEAADDAGCDLGEMNIHQPYVLFVGTIEPRKNLRRLLEAYAMMPENIRQEYLLVIVGGAGWGGDDIVRWSRELKVHDRLCLLGYLSSEKLSTLYRCAAVLAMPSLYEGFGLPLLEAMAVGTPVITSNVSSMPEVVGDAAVLVDPHNVQDISKGLTKLLANSTLRETMAAAGQQRAKSFSWDSAASRTLDLLETVAESPARP